MIESVATTRIPPSTTLSPIRRSRLVNDGCWRATGAGVGIDRAEPPSGPAFCSRFWSDMFRTIYRLKALVCHAENHAASSLPTFGPAPSVLSRVNMEWVGAGSGELEAANVTVIGRGPLKPARYVIFSASDSE